MKRMTILIGSFLWFLFLSCHNLLFRKYHFNKEFRYKTSADYLKYLSANKEFDLSHVLYPDSVTAGEFINHLYARKMLIYYGSLLNDTIEIRKSAKLEDNLSCMGRVLSDLNEATSRDIMADTSLYIKSDWGKFRFRYITSGNIFSMNRITAPLKIFLLYSYSYGSYFDPLLREMKRFAAENAGKADVYIIDLDYVFHFK